jgi:hypothetical protein
LTEGAHQAATAGFDPAALSALHARLLRDRDLQFAFPAVRTPSPFRQPDWLKALEDLIVRAFEAAWPVLKVLFWVGLALGAVLVLWLIGRELWGVRFARRRRAKAARATPADWRPDPLRAAALLENADRLAAQGRFDMAVRLILHRGVEDIDHRRPHAVRPALTARDIAALEAIPPAARTAFARIAAVVEFSAFAGRPIGEAAFARCRQAYEAFAAAEAWA